MHIFSPHLSHEIAVFFKTFEWFFWLAQAWLFIVLIKTRAVFEGNLKLINRLLKVQGFDVQLPSTEKAFKIWKRDLTILFFLNPLIIIFIHLI